MFQYETNKQHGTQSEDNEAFPSSEEKATCS